MATSAVTEIVNDESKVTNVADSMKKIKLNTWIIKIVVVNTK